MNNLIYSRVCNHGRLTRINNNFVRCLDCGQSMVSQDRLATNKTPKDFVKENKSFVRNFDRNFTNILEETDETNNNPLYEYFIDRNWRNLVIVNRAVQFSTTPAKYEVIINGERAYLDDAKIGKLLADLNAIRVDEQQVKSRLNNLSKN